MASSMEESNQWLNQIIRKYPTIPGVSCAIVKNGAVKSYCAGFANPKLKTPVTANTLFQIGSITQTLAVFSVLQNQPFGLEENINLLLARGGSAFQIDLKEGHSSWPNNVTVKDLMNHTALNMPEAPGIPEGDTLPATIDFLNGIEKYGYDKITISKQPGCKFDYSCGGYVLLQHLLECHSHGETLAQIVQKSLGQSVSDKVYFKLKEIEEERNVAMGHKDVDQEVRAQYPGLASGYATPCMIAELILNLTKARLSPQGHMNISHEIAKLMLTPEDFGSLDKLKCYSGLGIFVLKAGKNLIAMHAGATDGFQSVYMICFEGPDCGKGLVISCNGEKDGVLLMSEISSIIFKQLNFSGMDFSRMMQEINLEETGSNIILGMKSLIFDAFLDPPVSLKRKFILMDDAPIKRIKQDTSSTNTRLRFRNPLF